MPVRPSDEANVKSKSDDEAQDGGTGDEEDMRCRECGEDDADDMEAGEEELKVKEVRSPGQPSKSEKDHHELTHMPFRSWCKHCVRGKSKESPHRKKTAAEMKEVEEGMPTIHVDYCFQSKDKATKLITTLVMRERPSGSTASIVAPAKGRDDYVVRRIVETLKQWGNTKVKIIIRSDGEPAIKALVKMVQSSRELEHAVQTGVSIGGTVVEEAPKNDSASMGVAEKAVQEIECQARTWLSHVEDKLREPVKANSPLIIWLIEHMSSIINRAKIGPDGKTPYSRIKGKDSRTKLVPFGEKVLWMISKEERKKGPKMAPRFHYGIWVGVNDASGEYLLLTPGGLKKARTIRRLPEEDKWDGEYVNLCKGTPWDHEGKEAVEDIRADIDMPAAVEHKGEGTDEGARMQRMRITNEDVQAHGPTRGCQGCRAVALKLKSQTHSESCRTRMTKLISQTPHGAERVQAAEEKVSEMLAEKLERDIKKSEDKDRRGRDELTAEDMPKKKVRMEKESAAEEGDVDARASGSRSEGERQKDEEEDVEKKAKRQRLNDEVNDEELMIMYVSHGGRKQDREEVWDKISKDKPDMIAGRMGKSCSREEFKFFGEIYEHQVKADKYFVHEDKSDRRFERSGDASKLVVNKGVHQLAGHWGGKNNPIVNVITNSLILAEKLGIELVDQDLSKNTGKFKKAIRDATAQQVTADEKISKRMVLAAVADQEDGVKGEYVEEHVDVVGAEQFFDHVNGGDLDPTRVKAARMEEMKYFRKMRVYDKVPRSKCWNRNKKTIKLRWVDTCKSDGTYRSRLVAKEFKTNNNPEFFSATPPTESLKMILSLVAASQVCSDGWGEWQQGDRVHMRGDGSDDKICVLYSDISRAYFHAEAK